MPNRPRPENPARPVRMDDELWARVRDYATRTDKTASEVVRTAVREFLERCSR